MAPQTKPAMPPPLKFTEEDFREGRVRSSMSNVLFGGNTLVPTKKFHQFYGTNGNGGWGLSQSDRRRVEEIRRAMSDNSASDSSSEDQPLIVKKAVQKTFKQSKSCKAAKPVKKSRTYKDERLARKLQAKYEEKALEQAKDESLREHKKKLKAQVDSDEQFAKSLQCKYKKQAQIDADEKSAKKMQSKYDNGAASEGEAPTKCKKTAWKKKSNLMRERAVKSTASTSGDETERLSAAEVTDTEAENTDSTYDNRSTAATISNDEDGFLTDAESEAETKATTSASESGISDAGIDDSVPTVTHTKGKKYRRNHKHPDNRKNSRNQDYSGSENDKTRSKTNKKENAATDGNWSALEDNMITFMKSKDASWAEIAERTGRGKKEVQKRWKALSVWIPDAPTDVEETDASAAQQSDIDTNVSPEKSKGKKKNSGGKKLHKKKSHGELEEEVKERPANTRKQRQASKLSVSSGKSSGASSSSDAVSFEFAPGEEDRAKIDNQPDIFTGHDGEPRFGSLEFGGQYFGQQPYAYDRTEDPSPYYARGQYVPSETTRMLSGPDWIHEKHREQRHKELYIDPYAAVGPEVSPGVGFSEIDAAKLSAMAGRDDAQRLLRLQQEYYNSTGRMVDLDVLKWKLGEEEGEGRMEKRTGNRRVINGY